MTDAVGIEDSPAISPDGKTVAFVAAVDGHRQVFVKLISGGTPLQLTRVAINHLRPRWLPDSSALIYFVPSATPGEEGTIFEVSALGGTPRVLANALVDADVSHDGRRLAIFQADGAAGRLSVVARDGSGANVVARIADADGYQSPRWSPDDRWIAFQAITAMTFESTIFVVASSGGQPRAITHANDFRGLAWLPDSSGIVFSSSDGSTMLYPATHNLRTVRVDGSGQRQLTFGDVSYHQPDVHASGVITASRQTSRSEIWRFPTTGSAIENVRSAVRITHQTGAAQTPAVSPDASQVAYLSDTGGHANVWVVNADGSNARQLTFEQDPAVAVGVVVWSSTTNALAYFLAQGNTVAQWSIQSDGSGRRQLTPRGVAAAWSRDDRWLYTSVNEQGKYCIEKTPVAGGPPVIVRCDDAYSPAPGVDGSTLFYLKTLKQSTGGWDWELRRAQPEDSDSEVLARVAGARIPIEPFMFNPLPSPDGRWLAAPLVDGDTTNLWAWPTTGGEPHKLTDFGSRAVVIARRATWAPDGKSIYAAVADIDTDIVLLTGLLR